MMKDVNNEIMPFDIDKWMTGNYNVVTRDDCDVKILYTNYKDEHFPIVGIIELNEERELLATFRSDGRYNVKRDDNDLFLIEKETLKVGDFVTIAFSDDLGESDFIYVVYRLDKELRECDIVPIIHKSVGCVGAGMIPSEAVNIKLIRKVNEQELEEVRAKIEENKAML